MAQHRGLFAFRPEVHREQPGLRCERGHLHVRALPAGEVLQQHQRHPVVEIGWHLELAARRLLLRAPLLLDARLVVARLSIERDLGRWKGRPVLAQAISLQREHASLRIGGDLVVDRAVLPVEEKTALDQTVSRMLPELPVPDRRPLERAEHEESAKIPLRELDGDWGGLESEYREDEHQPDRGERRAEPVTRAHRPKPPNREDALPMGAFASCYFALRVRSSSGAEYGKFAMFPSPLFATFGPTPFRNAGSRTGPNIARSWRICWIFCKICVRTRGFCSFTCSENRPSISGYVL